MTSRTSDVGAMIREAAPVIARALEDDLGGAHPVEREDLLRFVERDRLSDALRARLERAYRSGALEQVRAQLSFVAFVSRLREEARRDWAARGART